MWKWWWVDSTAGIRCNTMCIPIHFVIKLNNFSPCLLFKYLSYLLSMEEAIVSILMTLPPFANRSGSHTQPPIYRFMTTVWSRWRCRHLYVQVHYMAVLIPQCIAIHSTWLPELWKWRVCALLSSTYMGNTSDKYQLLVWQNILWIEEY